MTAVAREARNVVGVPSKSIPSGKSTVRNGARARRYNVGSKRGELAASRRELMQKACSRTRRMDGRSEEKCAANAMQKCMLCVCVWTRDANMQCQLSTPEQQSSLVRLRPGGGRSSRRCWGDGAFQRIAFRFTTSRICMLWMLWDVTRQDQ